MRALWKSLLPLISCGIFAAACGGYSDEEANDACEIDQNNYAACFSDATFAACVDCYTQCGADCQVAESCPVQYVCPQ